MQEQPLSPAGDDASRRTVRLDYKHLQRDLGGVGYIADDALAMALANAITLKRPLLLEGEAGVGKTDVAKALAAALGTRLIPLQS